MVLFTYTVLLTFKRSKVLGAGERFCAAVVWTVCDRVGQCRVLKSCKRFYTFTKCIAFISVYVSVCILSVGYTNILIMH